jgi:hypothetical protein
VQPVGVGEFAISRLAQALVPAHTSACPRAAITAGHDRDAWPQSQRINGDVGGAGGLVSPGTTLGLNPAGAEYFYAY